MAAGPGTSGKTTTILSWKSFRTPFLAFETDLGRHTRRPVLSDMMAKQIRERAGFRPCKRCKPDRPPLEPLHATTVAAICRVIEVEEEMPSLSDQVRGSSTNLSRAVSAIAPVASKNGELPRSFVSDRVFAAHSPAIGPLSYCVLLISLILSSTRCRSSARSVAPSA
jgi:hypothetical protein